MVETPENGPQLSTQLDIISNLPQNKRVIPGESGLLTTGA